VTPPPDEPHDPQRCTACRGTGRVISNLGGESHEVACPWCDGTGRFIPGHDAQEGAPADVSSNP
jgi:DnaJ-class molecular chaperone